MPISNQITLHSFNSFIKSRDFYLPYSQGEYFESGVCLTLAIMLAKYISSYKPNSSSTNIFRNLYTDKNAISNYLTSKESELTNIHKQQLNYSLNLSGGDLYKLDINRDLDIFDIWGNYACMNLSKSILKLSKILFKKELDILISSRIYKRIENNLNIDKQIEDEISSLSYIFNSYEKGLFIFSFSYDLNINSGHQYYSPKTVYSKKNHSCLMFIQSDNFIFFDPNLGIIHQKKDLIYSLLNYLYDYYKLDKSAEKIFFIHSIK